jgi:hypothetical protein
MPDVSTLIRPLRSAGLLCLATLIATLTLQDGHSQSVSSLSCGVCSDPAKIAYGPFAIAVQHITHYDLPHAPSIPPDAVPVEPWLFEFTTMNADGRPCAVRRVRGPTGAFADAVSGAVSQWTFTPVQMRSGSPGCFRTRVFFYLRTHNGKVIVEVPGLTPRP